MAEPFSRRINVVGSHKPHLAMLPPAHQAVFGESTWLQSVRMTRKHTQHPGSLAQIFSVSLRDSLYAWVAVGANGSGKSNFFQGVSPSHRHGVNFYNPLHSHRHAGPESATAPERLRRGPAVMLETLAVPEAGAGCSYSLRAQRGRGQPAAG